MRASEALLLGSTMMKPAAYTRKRAGEDSGCALGMMGLAAGNTLWVEGVFSWLVNPVEAAPCGCFPHHEGHKNNVANFIAHLFNEHVMQGSVPVGMEPKRVWGHVPNAEPWTIEQLATWIASVDPTPLEQTEPMEANAKADQNRVGQSSSADSTPAIGTR